MGTVDTLAFSGPSAARPGALLVVELRAPPTCVAALAKSQWAGPTLAWRPCADFTEGAVRGALIPLQRVSHRLTQSLMSNRHELVIPEAQQLAQTLLGLSATRPSLRAALTFPTSSSPRPNVSPSIPVQPSPVARSDAPSPSLGPATPSMELPRPTGTTPRTPTTAQVFAAMAPSPVRPVAAR